MAEEAMMNEYDRGTQLRAAQAAARLQSSQEENASEKESSFSFKKRIEQWVCFVPIIGALYIIFSAAVFGRKVKLSLGQLIIIIYINVVSGISLFVGLILETMIITWAGASFGQKLEWFVAAMQSMGWATMEALVNLFS